MLKERKLEIENLIERGSFIVVMHQEILPQANILPGLHTLDFKSTIDRSKFHKARFVIGGHKNQLKNFIGTSIFYDIIELHYTSSGRTINLWYPGLKIRYDSIIFAVRNTTCSSLITLHISTITTFVT